MWIKQFVQLVSVWLRPSRVYCGDIAFDPVLYIFLNWLVCTLACRQPCRQSFFASLSSRSRLVGVASFVYIITRDYFKLVFPKYITFINIAIST